MSTRGDDSPNSSGKRAMEERTAMSPSSMSYTGVAAGESSSIGESLSAPKVSIHQEVVEAVWPLLMKEVEKRMIHMEQELIKRHNIKMMNEMQEVVRQIKQAKTKNDEALRDTQKKQGDVARSVLEIAEKLASMRAEVEELKRQAVINKQQLTHRCDQTTDQVSQLKHAVFTAWQKEKAEIQQKVSQSFRGDLSAVLSQFDAKLKESFSETSKLRYEVKRVTAKMNGEDPDAVTFEMPQYVDTTVPPAAATPPENSTPLGSEDPSSSATSTAPMPSVNMQSLTQNLAMFIARQQQASGSSGPPQVNVAMLQQFMQTLPRQQQLQLQMLLQQHRASQQSPPHPTPSTSVGATAPTPSVPPGLGLPTAGSPTSSSSASPPAPAATMIQSLAQQLQLQVNAAQQKASSAGAGSVNCPFFSMFGWCKFGERCKYLHQPTGKEPLRNLPQSVIQTLQTQLASGSTAETTQTLMTALAGLASKQQQQQQQQPQTTSTTTTSSSTNAVQQAMIQAQIQAQQDAAQLGSSKAKTMPCRFYAIGRCAYGDRCAYSHGKDTSSTVAAAAAAAWGKTDLSQASWGSSGAAVAPTAPKDFVGGEEEGIMDGEDDTNYDQWNAMTFEDSSTAAPPGL